MLASNEDKQVQGNSSVVRYFVRECRYCGGVMKIQMMGGKIIHFEGCEQAVLFKPHVDKDSGKIVVFIKSQKLVKCFNHRRGNPLGRCNRNAQVGRFHEIFP